MKMKEAFISLGITVVMLMVVSCATTRNPAFIEINTVPKLNGTVSFIGVLLQSKVEKRAAIGRGGSKLVYRVYFGNSIPVFEQVLKSLNETILSSLYYKGLPAQQIDSFNLFLSSNSIVVPFVTIPRFIPTYDNGSDKMDSYVLDIYNKELKSDYYLQIACTFQDYKGADIFFNDTWIKPQMTVTLYNKAGSKIYSKIYSDKVTLPSDTILSTTNAWYAATQIFIKQISTQMNKDFEFLSTAKVPTKNESLQGIFSKSAAVQ